MRRASALLSLIVVLTGCSGASSDDSLGATRDDSTAPDRVTSALRSVDAEFPAPLGEVVLTIRDAGDGQRSVAELDLDVAGLESLGTITMDVNEPFVNETISFTGVPVDAVLAAARIDAGQALVWTALDDYQVDYTRGEAAAESALLATRQDGRPIDVADGGPIRVVFPDHNGPLGGAPGEWIWSVRLIETDTGR